MNEFEDFGEILDRWTGEDVWLYVYIDVAGSWAHGKIFGTLHNTGHGQRWLRGKLPGSESGVREEFSFNDDQVNEIIEDEAEPIIRLLIK